MRACVLSSFVLLAACDPEGPAGNFPLDDGTPVKPKVAAGARHTCRVNADKTVSCWGFNMYAALGSGIDEGLLFSPTVVPGLGDVEEVAAGANHSCARLTDGTVKCWGMANNGRVGNGAADGYVAPPTLVNNLSGAVHLAAGDSHSCALLSDGTVKCWGANEMNQCALGSARQVLAATTVTSLTGVAQLALAKDRFGCARLQDGTAKCWGLDSVSGRLGLGDGTVEKYSPSVVMGASNLTHLSAGADLVCGRSSDGKVWCWGEGFGGTPREVTSAAPAVEVVVGMSTFCVRKANREVWCGRGDGTAAPKLTRVTGLAGAAQLTLGESHTCAWALDDTTWCWGDNHYGQVGDGTKVDFRTDPVKTQ